MIKKKGGISVVNSINSASIQNMVYTKQNVQSNSKASEEASESAAEKTREACNVHPSNGGRLDILA